jgi:hypothetical protein
VGAYVAWKWIGRQRFLRKIRIARITPEELKTMMDGGQDLMVVDVRDRVDFEAAPAIIPGVLHLSIYERSPRGVTAAVADGAVAIGSVREYLGTDS